MICQYLGPAQIPDEHSFMLGEVQNQTMIVLAEDKSGLNEDVEIKYVSCWRMQFERVLNPQYDLWD